MGRLISIIRFGVFMSVELIGVIGAGQMGNGIAQVAACAGYNVVIVDIKQEYLEKGILNIKNSLDKLVKKERLSRKEADELIMAAREIAYK